MQLNHSEASRSIMYVGPKGIKTDTVTGFKPQLRFKRFEPTEVPYSVALQLLSFDCFTEASQKSLEAAKQAEELEAKRLADEAAEAERKAKEEADKVDTVVMVEGEGVDLGKYTAAQLATFVEANDLEVKQEAGEKVDEFRLRVRDAYRAKEQAGE